MPQQQQQQQIVRPPEQITLELRWNYFRAAPVRPQTRYFVFAALLILGIIIFHNLFWTIVLALCLIPIVWRFVKWFKELNRPMITDLEYMQWVWSHAEAVKKEGKDKFALGREASSPRNQAEPQIIQGFVFASDADAQNYPLRLIKKGTDGRHRTSVSRFFVICLLEHELGIYVRDINALDEFCIKKDSTYYYEMVTGISMKTHGDFGVDSTNASDIIRADYFAVTMASGHEIGMTVVRDNDMTDKTVAELRRLLGEKKYRGQGFPGTPGGYAGAPGGYAGGYAGVPNQYPNPTTGPFPGGASDYPGAPNPYSGMLTPYPSNTGPFPGNASSYPGTQTPYPANTEPNSGAPNPYSANTEPNSGVPNPSSESATD